MKSTKIVVSTLLLLFLCSCSTKKLVNKAPQVKDKSIVILFDNDVHCAIDGYAKLAGLRDAIQSADTAYVGITSSGDFLNGDVTGAISRGQYIVDIMRNVGYDAITLGNHEFDFSTPRMMNLLPKIKAPIVCVNFFENGATTPTYLPYVIKNYGTKRIGFIGICTPESMRSEGYAFYDEKHNLLYDLKPNEVFDLVQKAVDQMRSEGADYVVALAHLGEQEILEGVDSHKLIAATHGIDVVLDGHTHSVIPHDEVINKQGKAIGVAQTGTQFANVGKLLITSDGKFFTSMIPASELKYTNSQVLASTDSVKALMSATTDRMVGMCDYELTINDAKGDRLARSGETNLGDLCTDALRDTYNTDFGLVNGGGIRNCISADTITFGKVVGAFPFYNLACVIEVTGSQVIEMLKTCTANYPVEDGNFPQVSGMKYTLHGITHQIDQVLVQNRETGDYEPIKTDATYTMATTDYYSVGGYYGKLNDAKLIKQTGEIFYETVANYIKKNLNGVVGDLYRNPQGRITIVND